MLYLHWLGGSSWIQTSASASAAWKAIVSDSTGQILVACAEKYGPEGGGIYKSTSGGNSWSLLTSAPSGTRVGWLAIASDSTGMFLAACSDFKPVSRFDSGGGAIHTSIDGGNTWTQRSVFSSEYAKWLSIAIDSTGSRIYAILREGSMYISTSSGNTWTQMSVGGGEWCNIVTDSSGMYVAAGYRHHEIWTSSDGGNTWALTSSGIPSSSNDWVSLASSTSGYVLASALGNGGIYTVKLVSEPTSQPSSQPSSSPIIHTRPTATKKRPTPRPTKRPKRYHHYYYYYYYYYYYFIIILLLLLLLLVLVVLLSLLLSLLL